MWTNDSQNNPQCCHSMVFRCSGIDVGVVKALVRWWPRIRDTPTRLPYMSARMLVCAHMNVYKARTHLRLLTLSRVYLLRALITHAQTHTHTHALIQSPLMSLSLSGVATARVALPVWREGAGIAFYWHEEVEEWGSLHPVLFMNLLLMLWTTNHRNSPRS